MKFEEKRISREEFFKIDEKNVMFITNPGRMGDEDGITFIVKDNNEFKIYRLGDWMYRTKDFNEDEFISLNDAESQFPEWFEAWKNEGNKDYKGKYTHIYMGFGNGLSVDNTIYNEFKPFLDKRVEEYLQKEENKESLKYAAIFDTWNEAFIDMVNEKTD